MDPQSIVYEISRQYTLDRSVNSTLSDQVNGFRRSRDLERLSTCSSLFDWSLHTVEDWSFLRQTEAFFKKNRSFSDRSLLSAAAKQSFIDCEAKCRDTNDRIRDILLGVRLLDVATKQKMYRARSYINRVLGSFKSFTEQIPSLVRVTSGATSNAPRAQSLPQQKLSLKPYCSSKAIGLVRDLYRNFGFEKVRPRACDSNRLELVPKDWKKDRTIACEPEGSVALQLAFDSWAKRRLRRFGIDLSDQTRNQRLAKHASVHDDFVTVDFSNASDLVSYATVCWMFPAPWVHFLDQVRSPLYRGVFGSGTYEKFSSMGNGSTFAIETLVFAGLCYAAGSRNFLVYGDDVIIEKEYFASFSALSSLLGFVTNAGKTFSSGPFRESCGKEYFRGRDVTPVFIRCIDRRKANLCHLVNSMRSLTSPFENLGMLLDALTRAEHLPWVPYTENSMAGVWIDPTTARQLGVLRYRRISRTGPRLLYFKSYVPLQERRDFIGIRGYYLWFLHRNSQVHYAGPWQYGESCDPLQTSSAPVFQHSYVRKWVVWHLPHEGTPDFVYLYGVGKRISGE